MTNIIEHTEGQGSVESLTSQGHDSVEYEGAMSLNNVCQHWIRFDYDEDEGVSHASRHATHNSADFHRVQLTNHHPRHHQEAHRASDHERENAGDRYPRVQRHDSLGVTSRFVIEVASKSNH